MLIMPKGKGTYGTKKGRPPKKGGKKIMAHKGKGSCGGMKKGKGGKR